MLSVCMVNADMCVPSGMSCAVRASDIMTCQLAATDCRGVTQKSAPRR